MKNIIVTIAEILLGVALFLLLVGPNSLKTEASRVFQVGIDELARISTNLP